MPSVVGLQLDEAKHEVEAAGHRGDVIVNGGGLFGVLKESNWQVCHQKPGPGAEIASKPELTVERSCSDSVEAPRDEPPASQSGTGSPEREPSTSSAPPPSTPVTGTIPLPVRPLSPQCGKAFEDLKPVADSDDATVAPKIRGVLMECPTLSEWRAGLIDIGVMNHVFGTPQGERMVRIELELECTLFSGYSDFPVCAEAISLGLLWEES